MTFRNLNVLMGLLVMVAVGNTVQATDKKASATQPAKLTCEDFIALDDNVKPRVVYWAEGYSQKGKPEDAFVDIKETDRLVPVLIEECTRTPKQSFWSKAKTKFKKVF